MVTFCLFVSVAAAPPQVPADHYMQPAFYPAGSTREHPEAVGGHASSENFPVPFAARKGLPRTIHVVLGKGAKAGTLSVQVRNGTDKEKWFGAADGNLQAFLEAKDTKGEWRPIQFHHWAWCGNSWHRVLLPSMHQWSIDAALPIGSFRTQVRVRLRNEQEELTSNVLTLAIPKERFSLSPDVSKTQRLHLGWAVPTIIPKDMQIR